MGSHVRVHPRPVKALHEALLGFVHAIVPGEKLAMGLCECVRDKCGREKKYHSAGFKLPFDSAPDQTIFDKAVIGKKFD